MILLLIITIITFAQLLRVLANTCDWSGSNKYNNDNNFCSSLIKSDRLQQQQLLLLLLLSVKLAGNNLPNNSGLGNITPQNNLCKFVPG